MATRVRAAGRFANLVGSDSEEDLGGMDSRAAYPRKRQASVARSTAPNRISKPVSKIEGSIERKVPRRQSPRRPALTDRSNFNATRPPREDDKRKPFHLAGDETADEGSMFESRPSTGMRKKQRLEDSRPIKHCAAGNSGRYSSSSPRHEARRNNLHLDSVPKAQEDDDMDMVDVIEAQTVYARPQAAVPATSQAQPATRSHGVYEDNSSLQRRLRELTRKYENLEGRYTELREVGVVSAERNYEKMRKQADENTANANKLIAKLKEEVAAQRQAAGDGESLRRQYQERVEESECNAEKLSNKVTELTNLLTEADRQVKALNAKLVASRAGPGGAVPGSAVKGNAAKAWTGQSELVHAAHAKEDLYADLTGLIIQGVKQDGKEDIFDCIQTGRNGTLHFKLSLPSNNGGPCRYDESVVKYNPQLQPGRDSDLIDRLPEYLREEIDFERSQVANFYAKVVRVLKG